MKPRICVVLSNKCIRYMKLWTNVFSDTQIIDELTLDRKNIQT